MMRLKINVVTHIDSNCGFCKGEQTSNRLYLSYPCKSGIKHFACHTDRSCTFFGPSGKTEIASDPLLRDFWGIRNPEIAMVFFFILDILLWCLNYRLFINYRQHN
jgi:hypothetical protein